LSFVLYIINDIDANISFQGDVIVVDTLENLPFVNVQFDLRPPVNSGPHVDLRLRIKTQPLLITFSRPLVDRIGKQFLNIQLQISNSRQFEYSFFKR
jgi:hypothetical protein